MVEHDLFDLLDLLDFDVLRIFSLDIARFLSASL